MLTRLTSSTGIDHAFHALALDEYRGPFTPTLWYLPTDDSVHGMSRSLKKLITGFTYLV
jgi:hypothetical protein